MIDFLQGYILLAYRDSVAFCNVNDCGIEWDSDSEPGKASRSTREYAIVEEAIDIEESAICKGELPSN